LPADGGIIALNEGRFARLVKPDHLEAPVNVADIEGIGPAFAEKLAKAGVKTTDGLLKAGATAKGRKEIAAASGISDSKILEWVNRADLYRIKGVGSEYSDLLEAAGVDTVKELAQRKPENLVEAMTKTNADKKLVRRLPTLDEVKDWVEQAKKLPRVVEY
jgi:predicted flap endonuclease-1-like 5' DNA nuclease